MVDHFNNLNWIFSTALCAQDKLTVDSSVVVGEAGAAVMRAWTMREVAVAVVGWSARYHGRAILQTQRRKRKKSVLRS